MQFLNERFLVGTTTLEGSQYIESFNLQLGQGGLKFTTAL